MYGKTTIKIENLNDLDVPLLHISETLVKAKPPGGTPSYKPYRYVPPHRVGFLRRFGLKTGIHFCPFWSGIGLGFRGN